MSQEQMQNEIYYQMSRKIIAGMLNQGLITDREYHKIDCLNRTSFQPQLAKLME